jgi:hypothetical protein
MNSQQQEVAVKTNCKECVFAIYDDKTQTSCAFNRIEKFGSSIIESYDNEKEFYVINRLCNYYRHANWGYSQDDKEKVEHESALSFDIFVDCNGLSIDTKQDVINLIKSCSYYADKTEWFLYHETARYDDLKPHIASILSQAGRKVNVSVCEDSEWFLHHTVLKSSNVYHMLLQPTYPDNLGIMGYLNRYVNQDMKRFICSNENNVNVVSNYIYKMYYNMYGDPNYTNNISKILNELKDTQMYVKI